MPVKFDSTERFLEAVAYLKQSGKVKSNRELCIKIGISPSLITEAQNGRTKISLTKLVKLAEMYREISRDYLIDGAGPMIVEQPSPGYFGENPFAVKGFVVNDEIGHLKNMIEAKDQIIASLRETVDILKREVKRLGGEI